MARFFRVLLFAIAAPGAAFAIEADINQQIATVRAVKEIALAPDGARVAAAITDSTQGGGRVHIWLLARGTAPRQVMASDSTNPTDESAPAWDHEGRRIYYIVKTAGQASVQRVAASGDTQERFLLARDGTIVSGGWGGYAVGKRTMAEGFALAPLDTEMAVWAADGSDQRDRTRTKNDQYVFGESAKVRLYLTDADSRPHKIALPTIQSMAWSADGRGAAYLAQCRRSAPTICRDLYVQPLSGGSPRDLTEGIDGSVISGPAVTHDGEILVTVARGFEQQVARIRASDGQSVSIKALPPIVREIATNTNRSGFVLIAADHGMAASVRWSDRRLRTSTPLGSPALAPADWAPLRAKPLEWTNEGHQIEGLLYMPHSTATVSPATGRVPRVVDVHGGPANHFEDTDYPLVRLLLAQGWAVLHINPRGSTGYGSDFLAANQDDLGGGDYRDIMAGVVTALLTAPLDRDRLALIGFSYGGTIAGFALGRTNRFKALVSAAPVADQFSEYGTEDSSRYDRWYFGQPWRRFEAAWRQSPLSGVPAAKTPVFLLQGEADAEDPPGQSLELYRALRQEGARAELVLFPRESHRELGQNILGYPSVEPHHGLALRKRIIDFVHAAFFPVREGAGSEVMVGHE